MKKIILVCLLLSAGCESLDSMNTRREAATTDTQAKLGEVTEIPETNRIVHFSDSAFIANSSAGIKYVEPLPAVFSKDITINEGPALTINDIAERITQKFAVPVRLLSEMSMSQPASQVSVGGLPPIPAGIPSLTLPAPSATPSVTSSYNTDMGGSMHISYSGGLSGLLDLVASKNNVSWRYQNGAVEIYKYLTKTFKVHALPGTSELSASVERAGTGSTGSGGQMGGGGAGATTATTGSTGGNSNTQTTSIDAPELSVWKDIDASIKTMLGPNGKVVVSQSSGTVTVTDTPQAVGQIERYIDETNTIMTKQVVIHYRVLTVDHNDATRMGINWTAVFNAMNKNYGITLASMALPHASAGSALLSALIPNTATGGMGQFAGSNVLIDALETQGRVSRVTSGALTTLNNQPAPVQVVNETSYLASVSAQQTVNVGSLSALIPGKVVTGFSMTLMPHILDDDRVLMQYNINISALRALVERTSGDSTIQTPEVDTRSFMQKTSMRAGETLILSGFERSGLTLDQTGSIMKGGGQEATEDKAVVVILITPILTAG